MRVITLQHRTVPREDHQRTLTYSENQKMLVLATHLTQDSYRPPNKPNRLVNHRFQPPDTTTKRTHLPTEATHQPLRPLLRRPSTDPSHPRDSHTTMQPITPHNLPPTPKLSILFQLFRGQIAHPRSPLPRMPQRICAYEPIRTCAVMTPSCARPPRSSCLVRCVRLQGVSSALPTRAKSYPVHLPHFLE